MHDVRLNSASSKGVVLGGIRKSHKPADAQTVHGQKNAAFLGKHVQPSDNASEFTYMQAAPDHIVRESRHFRDDETIGNLPGPDARDLTEEDSNHMIAAADLSEVSNQQAASTHEL